jgi:hypothetical protein
MKIAREQRLEQGVKLYRGLGGDKAFPPFFHRSDTKGRKGILEWGFMSTTTSKEIAAQYSWIKEGKPLPTIFAMDAGAVDRGAVIRELSQYPGGHALRCSLPSIFCSRAFKRTESDMCFGAQCFSVYSQ